MKLADFIKNNYLLLLILLMAAALRMYHISFQSPWLDELHTLNEANPSNSLTGVYDKLLDSEPHPPLYFYLVHFCFLIFGYTIETARMFSVVCGVAGVYALYLLGNLIFTKRAGVFAALLLSVNAFHIQYSQDARMYAFFFLFTTLSLYSFIKFIKSPTWNNTVYYGLFSTLMIYGHFFGLLGLFAQYLILLVLICTNRQSGKRIIIKSFVAGIITFLLYIPALKLFFKAAGLKNIWIPQPEPDVYVQLFKALIGGSRVLLAIFCVLLALYIFKNIWTKRKLTPADSVNTKSYDIKVFIVLIMWISVVLIIPLIKSYISLPIIVERYFINILPVILIMSVLGLFTIKVAVIRNVTIILITCLSLYHLVLKNKYYTTTAKTQFREVTQFIKNNNKDNTPIVSALAWYLPYFLKNDSVDYNITDSSLQDYIGRLRRDTINLKPFWYVDGHHRPYSVSPEAEMFLKQHYYVQNNIDVYDAWAKHYSLKKNAPKTVDLLHFGEIKENNGDPISFNFDNYEYSNNALKASGWAFLQNADSKSTMLYIVAVKEKKAAILPSQKARKEGINKYFNLSYDATNSGFIVDAPEIDLAPGMYNIGIYGQNKEAGKEGLILTDKTIEVK